MLLACRPGGPNCRSSTAADVTSGTRATAASRQAGTGHQAWLALACCLAAVAWGGNQFTPLLAAYQAERDLTTLGVNTLLAAYVVGIIPGLVSASRLIHRFGHRLVMLTGVAMSLVASGLLIAATNSFAGLFTGRALTGLGLGLGMVAGGSWMLSLGRQWHWPAGRAALRSALSLTAGFGLGPTFTGIWAQFGPDPLRLCFLPHVALAAVALGLGLRVGPGAFDGRSVVTAREPLGAGVITLWQIGGVAPWIFGSLGLAYAVLPQQVYDQLGDFRTLFLAVLCLTSLGSGFVTQRLVARFGRPGFGTSRVGLALFLAVAAIAAAGFARRTPGLVWIGAVALGVAYGLILIGCLAQVERTLPRSRQAAATALTYCLAYLGFAVPVVTAWLVRRGFAVPTLLWALAATATALWFITSLIARFALTRRSHP